MDKYDRLALAVIVVAVAGGVGYYMMVLSSEEVPTAENVHEEVWKACQANLRKRLTNPTGSTFQDSDGVSGTPEADDPVGEWTVKGWVDAKNQFGGTVRKTLVCGVTRDESGEIEVRYASMEER